MVKATYADYRVDITSAVKFLDGHTESGPSTHFSGSYRTAEAARQIGNLIDETVSSLHHDTFGRRLRSELKKLIVPVDEERHARVKIEITYYCEVHATAYFDDGDTQELNESRTITSPI